MDRAINRHARVPRLLRTDRAITSLDIAIGKDIASLSGAWKTTNMSLGASQIATEIQILGKSTMVK